MPSAAFAARQQAYLRSTNQSRQSKNSNEPIGKTYSLKKTLARQEDVEHKREETPLDKLVRLDSRQERNHDDEGSITDSLTSEDTYEDESSAIEVEEEQIPDINENANDVFLPESQTVVATAKEEMTLITTENQVELLSVYCEGEQEVASDFVDEDDSQVVSTIEEQEEEIPEINDQEEDVCLLEINTAAALTEEEAAFSTADIQEEEIPAVCVQHQELTTDIVLTTPNISKGVYDDEPQAANPVEEELLHYNVEVQEKQCPAINDQAQSVCMLETQTDAALSKKEAVLFITEVQEEQMPAVIEREQANVITERSSKASTSSKPARTTKINLDEYGFKYLRKRNDAIVKIQRFWRVKRMITQNRDFISYASKMQVMTFTKPAVIVQSQWRKYIARRNFEMLVDSVTVLQSIVRAWHCKQLKDHRQAVRQHRLNNASVRIQSIYRGYSTRCLYDLDEIIWQVIVLQSLVRRSIAIQTRYTLEGLNYLLMDSLVRKIQCAYRKHRNGTTITKRLLKQRRQDYGDYPEEDMLGLHYTETNNVAYVVDDVDEFESKCCEGSRCGFTDEVHEILMESGKWMYELVGDPLDVDTAENLISVMEMSEEASGCLCWNPTVDTTTSKVGRSSVVIIQSRWRAFIAARKYSAMKRNRA